MNHGYTFQWFLDDLDAVSPPHKRDDGTPYPKWLCIMKDSSGLVVHSQSDIDFGPFGSPDTERSEARKIEAKLALEAKAKRDQ